MEAVVIAWSAVVIIGPPYENVAPAGFRRARSSKEPVEPCNPTFSLIAMEISG
jgi:hypothetical protein